MSIVKGVSLMGLGTIMRLFGAFAGFAISARYLGPNDFGSLMYWVGAGSLLGIVSNFGFPVLLLKEIAGKSAPEVAALIGEALHGRVLLTFPLLVIFLGWLFSSPEKGWVVPICVVLAMLIESTIEMLSTGFRAGNRFDIEAKQSLLAAVLYAGSMALLSMFTGQLRWVAVGMMITRIVMLMICTLRLIGLVGQPIFGNMRCALKRLQLAIPYAIDSCLTASFGQVDSLVIGHQMGAAAVGIYQAGMRMFLAGAQLGSIFSNVFIPKIAGDLHQGAKPGTGRADTTLVQLAFLVSGFGVGLALIVLGPMVVTLAYGGGYMGLVHLMPWLGLLFTIRFAAAAWGLLLTAHGMQAFRAAMSTLHWVLIIVVALVAMPHAGLAGWVLGLMVGNAFLMFTYAGRCLRHGVGSPVILLAGCALIGVQSLIGFVLF